MANSCRLVLILYIFTSTVSSVPMSQNCPPTETLRLSRNSQLALECGSPCGLEAQETNLKYEWLRSSSSGSSGKGEEFKIETDGPRMVIKSVEYKDGGIYKCRCLPDGPQCQQNVYIISEMDFVASDKYIYSGNSVYLTCVVHMTHPNFTTITPKGSTEISKHYKNTVDDHAARTVVVIDDQKRLKEEYKCVMESYDKEKLVERLEKTISIYSYTPPEILYTNEVNVGRKENFGKSFQLNCTILSSPDTAAKVTWLYKSREILPDGGKYSEQVKRTPGSDGEVIHHILSVNDVQLSDVGTYTCQLDSDFGDEDQQDAHITFNNKETEKLNTEEKEKKGILPYYLIYIVGLALFVLGVWRCCGLSRRKGRKGMTPRQDSTSTYDPTGWCGGSDITMTRRKFT